MPLFADSAAGTALYAAAAGAFCLEGTVCQLVGVGSGGGGYLEISHHAGTAHSYAFGGDKAITETEGAQTGGIGDVSLRPGRAEAAGETTQLEKGCQLGSNCVLANLLKQGDYIA